MGGDARRHRVEEVPPVGGVDGPRRDGRRGGLPRAERSHGPGQVADETVDITKPTIFKPFNSGFIIFHPKFELVFNILNSFQLSLYTAKLHQAQYIQ